MKQNANSRQISIVAFRGSVEGVRSAKPKLQEKMEMRYIKYGDQFVTWPQLEMFVSLKFVLSIPDFDTSALSIVSLAVREEADER